MNGKNHLLMKTTHFLFSLLLTLTAQAGVKEDIAKEISTYEDSVRANTMKMIEAKTEAEKDTFRQSVPQVDAYAKKVMELIRSAPEQPQDTASGVQWLVVQAAGLEEGDQALDMLTQTHLKCSGIAIGIRSLQNQPFEEVVPTLQKIYKENPHPVERATALYALGVLHFNRFEQSMDPKAEEQYKEDALNFFTRISAEFPDAELEGFKISDRAAKMIYELGNLVVGSICPEIEGKDAEGQSFKLSDYRGKHVVLVFWGGWCHACHDVIPELGQFSDELKDRPVAVLGINTDIDSERAAAFTTYKVRFRNWCDGTTNGPITSQFNLKNFPTIYLLDPSGKILLKNTQLQLIKETLQKK
jgi:thiol-disulfide isomerase/thioredoxin